MRVYICDDDRNSQKRTLEILSAYQEELKLDCSCFDSGDQMLAAQDAPDVIFLDIKMKGMHGIDAAKAVNAAWPKSCIVFLTDYLIYATDVYQTEHTWFVLKSQFPDRVNEIMRKVQKELRTQRRDLIFHAGPDTLLLSPEEILYFERTLRQTKIIAAEGTWIISEKLSELETRLPDGLFLRCHNSFLISLCAVRSFRADSIILKNDARIPISRAYKKSVSTRMNQWILSHL